ncbi:nucleotidyltransferase family protein [Aerococcus vaginalis]
MPGCAVICEWNPFHNGHKYLAEQINQQLPEATIVAVMSGNFVQRGEPAITDKWTRAETALYNGYDLIYELPVWFASQPADYFAKGAVNEASALGCQYLAFGVETDKFSDYEQLADWVVAHPNWEAQFQAAVDGQTNRGQDRLQTLESLPERVPELGALSINFSEGGNTLLAFAYAKANAEAGHPLTLVPIARHVATHHTEAIHEGVSYTSSTAIRKHLNRQTQEGLSPLERVMPPALVEKLGRQDGLPTLETWYPYLRYLLLSQPLQTLANHYQMYEGIEHVLIRAAKKHSTYHGFLEDVTNRQWTIGRVQRALVMLGLGIHESEAFTAMQEEQPLFLLGANHEGRAYLKAQRDIVHFNYQLVNRVSKETVRRWPLWLRADRVYQTLLNPKAGEQNFGRVPLLIP